MEQNTPTNLFDLHVDAPTSSYLAEAAKWAKFIAIVGFIMCGFLVLVSFFAGTFLSAAFSRYGMEGGSAIGGIGGAFVTILYLGLALVCFFPFFYLFRFSTKMQIALKNNDQEQLNISAKNLKSYFKFYGILLVIVLAFYAIALIFMVVGAAASRA